MPGPIKGWILWTLTSAALPYSLYNASDIMKMTTIDLHLLWLEYECGIGGRKPARQFTTHERGRVKFKYRRRMVVWDTINYMVQAGFTAQVAVDKIYEVSGQITVTQIIDQMRCDAIGGGHPELR
jgi:hypothetical protein